MTQTLRMILVCTNGFCDFEKQNASLLALKAFCARALIRHVASTIPMTFTYTHTH